MKPPVTPPPGEIRYYPERPPGRNDERFYSQALALASRVTSTADKIYKSVMTACGIVFVITIMWLAYEQSDRSPPSDILGVRLMTPKVAPGGKLRVDFSIVRRRICQVDISSETLDGQGVIREGQSFHKDAGGPLGPDYVKRQFAMPEDAALGHGQLRVTLSWQCPGNPTQALDPITRVYRFNVEITSG